MESCSKQEPLLLKTPLVASIILFLLGMHQVLAQPTPSSQVQALEALYHTTNGSQWTSYCSSLWLSDEPPCSWFGVVCDGNYSVVELTLGNCNLQGTLPLTLDSIATLQLLSLSGNQISGSLPPWSQFSALQSLSLSNNLFESALPDVWGTTMPSLQTLDLSHNALSSTLPESWVGMKSLQTLTLSFNQLTAPLPESWVNLTQLWVLTLSNNPLSTTLPSSWSQLVPQTIDLSYTNVTGTLPASWCVLMARNLNLSHNGLTNLDDFYDPNCFNIGVLDISYNDFGHYDFPQWGSLTYGGKIYASHNFIGIPCHWRLVGDTLDLSHNMIDRLPPLSETCTYGGFLNTDLSWCSIGAIELSDVLAMFSNVRTLNLAGNGIFGSLPPMLNEAFSVCNFNEEDDCECWLNVDQTLVRGPIPEFYCQYPLSLSFVETSFTAPNCTSLCPWNATS